MIITDGDAAPDKRDRREAGLKRGAGLHPDPTRTKTLLDQVGQLPDHGTAAYDASRVPLADGLQSIGVYVGAQTLETDLCTLFGEEIVQAFQELSSNSNAIDDVRRGVTNEQGSTTDPDVRKDMLDRISDLGKGRFAQRLAAHIRTVDLQARIRTAARITNPGTPLDTRALRRLGTAAYLFLAWTTSPKRPAAPHSSLPGRTPTTTASRGEPMLQVSDALLSELEELHPTQRTAVLHPGSVVLRAGPGSGKTRTLVARAAYLLETQISAFRGIACITYTNAAADEIRRRVLQRGVRTDGRITCSTVHAFCLNEILRAFAPLTKEPAPQAGQVLGDKATQTLLQHCFDRVGIAETLAQFRTGESSRIRRALACEEPLDAFDPREVEAARLYEEQLTARGETDFEAMVTRALRIVREHEPVRDLLHARFPHLIVDEYQDLGGVLHELVVELHDLADITVFAVGDTDQSAYGFSGADAKYLTALAERDDFRDLPLDVNYRSGQKIIVAAEAALGTSRKRRARDGAPPGSVNFQPVEGGLNDHAGLACDLAQQAEQQQVRPERIAILYPQRGPLLDALLNELTQREINFLYERDDKLPTGTLSRFVQRCASRAVTNYQVHTASADERPDMLRRAEAPPLTQLEHFLTTLRAEAQLPSPVSRLALLRTLQTGLDPQPPYPLDAPPRPRLAPAATRPPRARRHRRPAP
ncbi:UvrD-helicase domain-containing protein [Streptomyces sp. NBC_00063]|uniref:UvrD-helicase domain-containing protein n=1 Tax=Streptomyces sp. NBC_00063 TaxID=2975638 RepID=UPI00225C1270|nr:ATP-dependent helicase [Streptomyces sp. NBC_00063]MCX5443864.1 ATP-dependent helicase [Streptomyces sp. NBC_00063]